MKGKLIFKILLLLLNSIISSLSFMYIAHNNIHYLLCIWYTILFFILILNAIILLIEIIGFLYNLDKDEFPKLTDMTLMNMILIPIGIYLYSYDQILMYNYFYRISLVVLCGITIIISIVSMIIEIINHKKKYIKIQNKENHIYT